MCRLSSRALRILLTRRHADLVISVFEGGALHIDAGFYAPVSPNADGPILVVCNDAGRDFQTLCEAVTGMDCDVVIQSRRPTETMGPVPPNVRVSRDWMTYADLRALYARARIVVVPLRPTPNASGVNRILEAMAMQRPVIVSDSPAIRDFIIPGETCLTVPCGDVEAMREAIERLLREPELAARLAQRASLMVEERFSAKAFAKSFAPVLRRFGAESHPV